MGGRGRGAGGEDLVEVVVERRKRLERIIGDSDVVGRHKSAVFGGARHVWERTEFEEVTRKRSSVEKKAASLNGSVLCFGLRMGRKRG